MTGFFEHADKVGFDIAWAKLPEVKKQRWLRFMRYIRSEVCELDILEGPDYWDERACDLSKRLHAETIKWLEYGGDINA